MITKSVKNIINDRNTSVQKHSRLSIKQNIRKMQCKNIIFVIDC